MRGARNVHIQTTHEGRHRTASRATIAVEPIYSAAMSSLLQPLHLLLMMFAGWVNRHQLDVIDYLQEENRVLKERLGGRRIRFTDAERRRLARKAYTLGRKVLNELETLVTPDTQLRWHRELVASKWNYSQRRGPGRPRVMKTIVDLILQMALENPRRIDIASPSVWLICDAVTLVVEARGRLRELWCMRGMCCRCESLRPDRSGTVPWAPWRG